MNLEQYINPIDENNRERPRCTLHNQELLIEGYFMLFNKRSKLITEDVFGTKMTFTEQFTHGSIDAALKKWNEGENHCAFKVNHHEIMNGKLRLSQNEKGGRFRFAMEVTKGNQNLYDQVRSGELNETSFNFSISREDYTMEPDPEYKDKVTTDGRRIIYERIITNVQFLGDVSLTKNPAYEGGKEVKACTMCSEGYVMENRGINHRPQNNYESMAEKAAFVEELLRQDAESNNKTTTKKKMDDNNKIIRERAFKQFTGIKGISDNASITSEAIRGMDTGNVQIVTKLVDAMVLPNPTGFKAQLEASGVNFLNKGKINRVNTNSFTVGRVDEHGEFPAFDDLSNLNPETFTTKRIGCTLIISNELLASSDFVNSLIAQADNEIFSDALAFLVGHYLTEFTEIPFANFTPEFVQGALAEVGLNGDFLSGENYMIPQMFVEVAGEQVVKRKGPKTFETGVSKNNIMWGIDKYALMPDVAIFGDFRFAFMNVITDLEVVKNTFTYAKSGDTEVTFFREIGIAITDTTKFCRSLPDGFF